MAIIQYEDLPVIRERFRDKKIVFCSGIFDITHAGHVLFFEDCKTYGDILAVAVGSDAIIRINKGPARPVLNEHLRLQMVDSLKPVYYCFIDAVSDCDNQLMIIDYVLDNLHPDVYVVNSDAFNIPYREEAAKRRGVKLVVLERWCPAEFEAVSTSGIIDKIQKIGK